MRIEHHPKLNVWVREDGCVYLPQSGKHPAHWTFGSKNTRGYLMVQIKGKDYKVHRLVAECYIPNPENKKEIDHINRNKLDNRVENLRWVTRSENNRNRSVNDRVDARGGTHSYEDYRRYHRELNARYNQTHRQVWFSDGKKRWFPIGQATELLKLPVKDRVYEAD